jgi:hypothetical protein
VLHHDASFSTQRTRKSGATGKKDSGPRHTETELLHIAKGSPFERQKRERQKRERQKRERQKRDEREVLRFMRREARS